MHDLAPHRLRWRGHPALNVVFTLPRPNNGNLSLAKQLTFLFDHIVMHAAENRTMCGPQPQKKSDGPGEQSNPEEKDKEHKQIRLGNHHQSGE